MLIFKIVRVIQCYPCNSGGIIVLQILLPVPSNGAVDGEYNIPLHLKPFQQCSVNTAHIMCPHFLLHNGVVL
jgi:hypothetical protein